MVNVRELKQQRAALKAKARELLDKAEKEQRDLTAEESQEFDRLMAEADALTRRIEREERLLSIPGGDAAPDPIAGRRGQPGDDQGDGRRGSPRASQEYRSAFLRYARVGRSGLGPDEVRALSEGVDAEGGYLVPEELERQLITALAEQNVMRRLASVVTAGTDRIIPVVTQRPGFAWIGENQDYPLTDARFATKTLSAHKLGGIILVSEELLRDSAFDLESFIRSEFALAAGQAEEQGYIAGTGTGQPTGVINDAEVGANAAAANAVTADELVDLYHSLKPQYRARATWLLHDSTAKVIRKLKTNDGVYIWQPGLVQDRPDTLFGRPVVASPYMPQIGANAKSILFGDFSYYRIQQRAGISIQRLNELFANKGQVGFRATMRVDGRLLLTEAVKALQHPEA